jgi:SHOCT-like domain
MAEIKRTTKIEVKPNLKVNISSENFSVRVTGWEEEIVELNTEMEFKQHGETEITLEEIIEIDYRENENTLNLTINDQDKVRISKARIDLKIPHVSQIKAEMENGTIKVNNLHGEQTFKTENGSIKLDNMNGKLACSSENGAVILNSCRADIIVETENGSLKAVDCEGKMTLKTENGAVKLKRCAGMLESETENGSVRIMEGGFSKAVINSDNGNIFYEFLPMEKGQFDFINDNGRIQLAIPESLEYEIKAKNKIGKFRINLPGDYERKHTDDKHILELSKGSGNVKINVQNEYGSIQLGNFEGRKFDFDADKITHIFDSVMDRIPDDIEIDTEKIKATLDKAKEKMKHIRMPDSHKIQKQIDKAMNDVNKEMKNIKMDIQFDDIMEKADEAISKAVDVVKEKFSNEDMTQEENHESNRRGRLKILQLLQDGKINAEEAEDLLKAMDA